ncbi:hypothetical protein MTO96_023562 [Rhipicephalus appendiculatus]
MQAGPCARLARLHVAQYSSRFETVAASMASRKRKPLSIKEKLNILAVVDRNPKRKRIDIANELGLPASTVNTVVSKRKEIETNALVFGGATSKPVEPTMGSWRRRY